MSLIQVMHTMSPTCLGLHIEVELRADAVLGPADDVRRGVQRLGNGLLFGSVLVGIVAQRCKHDNTILSQWSCRHYDAAHVDVARPKCCQHRGMSNIGDIARHRPQSCRHGAVLFALAIKAGKTWRSVEELVHGKENAQRTWRVVEGVRAHGVGDGEHRLAQLVAALVADLNQLRRLLCNALRRQTGTGANHKGEHTNPEQGRHRVWSRLMSVVGVGMQLQESAHTKPCVPRACAR